MGFALQNANASRILQIFGADVHHLSWFWLVAPLMGLIVQPIVGHYSDRTWTKLGRRKPFFLSGAIIASIGLVLMPQSNLLTAMLPALWVGAGMLMVMDASFNLAMEPFRALVADMMPADQRTLGFSIQTVLIGIGAVVGSWLPYVLTNFLDISNQTAIGEVPLNLSLSFTLGAIILIGSTLVTVFSTKEYTPEEFENLDKNERQIVRQIRRQAITSNIWQDFLNIPHIMKQLSWVQFCSWFGLFGMWVYSTPAIAHHIYQLPISDHSSTKYQDAGDWVGVLFGIYNAISAIYAFFLPRIAHQFGRKQTHAISLSIGGAGLISIYFFTTPYQLILSMVGIGIAWASILAMPYAMLSGSIPNNKNGVYMGLFNFFIVIPQIINALISGPIVKNVFGGNPIYILLSSGVLFLIAAALSLRLKEV